MTRRNDEPLPATGDPTSENSLPATSGARPAALAHADREQAPARMCDTIEVGGHAGDGRVHVVEGEVAWMTSRLALPTLYARLIEHGHVLAKEIELVLALARPDRLDFCEILLDLELVRDAALADVMREHVGTQLRALLRLRHLHATRTRSELCFTGALTIPPADVLTEAELERWGMLIATTGGAIQDRRAEHRVSLHVMASVETPNGHSLMMLENLSSTGALLRSHVPLLLGTQLVVNTTVGGEKLELPAVVVRVGESAGPPAVGVRWRRFTDELRDQLDRAVLRERG